MDSFGKRDNKRLDKIIGAGGSHNMVYIKYKDRKGKVSTRYLEPYEVRGEDFFAFDPDKDSIRRFKIKRIQSLKSTKKKYEPRWDIKMPGLEKKANEFEYSPDEERLIGEIMLADSKGRLNELKREKKDAKLFDFKTKSTLNKGIKKSKKDINYNKDYLDMLGKTASEVIDALSKDKESVKMSEKMSASEHLGEMYKMAAIIEDSQLKNGKIPAIEKALHTDIEKEVATMLATSHEYKVPAVDAALAIVKNYKWEKASVNINNLQGIDKPVKKDKVLDIAVGVKKRGGVVSPFIVVDKLNGIKPQSPGKTILLDGHHRLEACKFLDKKEVPVYKGTFTGGAQKTKEELRKGR